MGPLALKPSALVKTFSPQIVRAARNYPIVDVACGSGRNSLGLLQLGSSVICVDRDLSRVESHRILNVSVMKQRLDIMAEPWPFGPSTIGGVLLVDFLYLPLFAHFADSLITGGYFLLETVSGRGGNYLELPGKGEIERAVQKTFDLEFYKETNVGPERLQRVTVKMLARRFRT